VIEEMILHGAYIQRISKAFIKKCQNSQKSIDNFHYRKYNYLVMNRNFRKEDSIKEKGECIHYEKAD